MNLLSTKNLYLINDSHSPLSTEQGITKQDKNTWICNIKAMEEVNKFSPNTILATN
jgi:hypothetical protein